MKNWKTTLSGVLAAVGLVLTHIPETSAIGNVLTALGTLFVGLTAKDSNVTGGTTPQNGGTIPMTAPVGK